MRRGSGSSAASFFVVRRGRDPLLVPKYAPAAPVDFVHDAIVCSYVIVDGRLVEQRRVGGACGCRGCSGSARSGGRSRVVGGWPCP